MLLVNKRAGERVAPLEQVVLAGASEGTITVYDSLGRAYVQQPAMHELPFVVGGASGYHLIVHTDTRGTITEQLSFRVSVHTHIADDTGFYQDLLAMLHYSMTGEWGAYHYARYNGRMYQIFVGWLRDHVHYMKGMKYFTGQLQDGIDLYRDSQRDDGMIWDNIYPRDPVPNYWDTRFREGNFIRIIENGTAEFKRIPVENDVEYLFVEGLYYTWKAEGDDGWMADTLDTAIKAMEYSVSSPYRWSEKYQLLKRGYTIDTWDFQNSFDSVVDGDAMRVDPQKTRFGVMFGDNTGYIASCHYLAEMLSYAGRHEEAARYRTRGHTMKERLDRLCWNGHFYTHHVREEPHPEIDLGVDEASQISLSNAYSLNRGLTHEQCVEIINTYQHVQAHLPQGSPGEWYLIYPPFQRGYGDHNGLWQYMNGGVSPIVGGELAHGAFQHGFESYGVDILRRLHTLAKQHNNYFHATYRGASTEPETRTFHPLTITSFANIDTAGNGAPGVPGWTGEGDNDMHEMISGEQCLLGIPFHIPDPNSNGRRAAIGLDQRDGYMKQVTLPVGRTATSVYFLHTVARTGESGIAGTITLRYTDGSSYNKYVVRGQNAQGWWLPETPQERGKKAAEVAWRGKNAHCDNIGVLAYGLDNPYPDKEIEAIHLTVSEEGAFWAIFAITLSEQPAYFTPSPISFGIPDGWGAGAVTYALIEGLVGVVDSSQCYRQVSLSPRWTAASVEQVEVAVTYPGSEGYVAYRYQHHHEQRTIQMTITGSGESCACHVLLPPECEQVRAVSTGAQHVTYTEQQIEQSRYVDFTLPLPGPIEVQISYT